MTLLENFDLVDYHYRSPHDILVSYKGPFDPHVLSFIGSYIKDLIDQSTDTGRKIFKIFIEVAQNISFYSAERNHFGHQDHAGVGTFVILEETEHYRLISGNVIKKDVEEMLMEKCNKIISLDKQGLRQYKRELLEQPDSTFGGANIGLIQIAITAETAFEFEIRKLNKETSFFILSIRIKK